MQYVIFVVTNPHGTEERTKGEGKMHAIEAETSK
jgi:hypothetical protein